MTEVIDEYSDRLLKKFQQDNYNRQRIQQYISGSVDDITKGVAAGTGPLAPFVIGAGKLFNWGYSTLYDDIAARRQQAERDKYFKQGVWYKNKNLQEDLDMVGGASTKAVPLGPQYKDTSKTIVYDKGISYAPGTPIIPAPIAPNLQFGWKDHYQPQIPIVPIDLSKNKLSLHPRKQYQPNATMNPQGGFR